MPAFLLLGKRLAGESMKAEFHTMTLVATDFESGWESIRKPSTIQEKLPFFPWGSVTRGLASPVIYHHAPSALRHGGNTY